MLLTNVRLYATERLRTIIFKVSDRIFTHITYHSVLQYITLPTNVRLCIRLRYRLREILCRFIQICSDLKYIPSIYRIGTVLKNNSSFCDVIRKKLIFPW